MEFVHLVVIFDQLLRAILRVVIDEDDLPVFITLGEDGIQAFPNSILAVPVDDDEADFPSIHFSSFQEGSLSIRDSRSISKTYFYTFPASLRIGIKNRYFILLIANRIKYS